MSVLVKGMKMPRDCKHCKIAFYDEVYGTICPFIGIAFEVDAKRQKTCPLVEVPTPHGRLNDADYLKEHIIACATNGRPLHNMELSELLEAIDDVPAVIEAEQ